MGIHEHLKKLGEVLTNHKPELLRLAFVLGTIIVLLLLFVNLADEVLEKSTDSLDRSALLAINERSNPVLDATFVNGTEAAGKIGASILTVLAVGIFAYRKHYRKALFIAVAIAGTALINLVLKLYFVRQRPDLWERLVDETTYSFPSGHAMISMAIALSLVLMLWRTKYRALATIMAFIYVLFIGFSRLYLGVHYPTDVLGGWLVSSAWVIACWLMFYSDKVRSKARVR